MSVNKTVNLTLGEFETEISTMIIDDSTYEIYREVYDVSIEVVEQPLSDWIHIPDDKKTHAIQIQDNESWYL